MPKMRPVTVQSFEEKIDNLKQLILKIIKKFYPNGEI